MTDAQKAFIDAVAPGAVNGWYTYSILPSLSIAQAILESAWGKSGLTAVSNNLFGMKWNGSGEYVSYGTKEYVNGAYISVIAKFKKYNSLAESITDHSRLLGTRQRYANLRGVTDHVKACKLVQEDGYATAPTYAQALINIIERYNLTDHDNVGIPLYEFHSGPVSAGDLKAFKDLAETLQLKNYSADKVD